MGRFHRQICQQIEKRRKKNFQRQNMQKHKTFIKTTILLCSMMTAMAGSIVAPALSQIKTEFIDVDYIDLLARLVITLPALFIAFFSPLIGVFSDRYGRKMILIISLVLYSIGGTSAFVLNNIYHILIGRAVLGVGVAGIMTITTSLIGDYFSGNERNNFTGFQGAFMGLGGVVFISVAGWLTDIHWQTPFLLYLFSIPLIAMVYVFIYEPKHFEIKDTKDESDVSYNRKLTYIIYLLMFASVVFFYLIPVQTPFLLSQEYGLSNTKIGYAISLSALTASIVAMNYMRVKRFFTFRQLYQLVLLFLSAGYFIIFLANSYAIVILGLIVAGLGTGLLMPTGSLWILFIAPQGIRATLIGRLSTALFLGQFFSPILVQPVINNFAVRHSFLAASVSMLLIIPILFTIRRES